MRCLLILFIFIVVYLVEAAIEDGNNPNEILDKDPSEATDVGTSDNTLTPPDDGLDEVSIFSEDIGYEEIDFISINKYIHFTEKISSHDESNSHMSQKDAFKRNKNGSPPKSSPSKIKTRKKRQASCSDMEQQTFNCDPNSKYRTINGSCNNLKHPEYGMAMGCQQRFLKANYDGMAGLRKSVNGGPLPEPRELSVNINTNESHPEIQRNQLSMFFGQAFAHDITLTPSFTTKYGEVLTCCEPDLVNDTRCENIYLPKNDSFYGQFNFTCIEFPRSVSCNSCDEDGRKLLNMNTAFVDGSLVYGSSVETAMALRANDGTGQLKTQKSPVGDLLLNSSNPDHDQCSFPNQSKICFQAGDERVNQHIIITCLHTIFMREHNRIASILKELNPSWDEETLYQETRRIVGAKFQVILFKEYLPIVFSHDMLSQYGLHFSDGFTTYNDTLNPTIWIEFSTAAFRVPHSMINSVVSREPRRVTEGYTLLRDLFSLPFGLHTAKFGELMGDTTKTLAQMVDRFAVEDTNEYLYRIPGTPGGLDLSAIDIQRGRDNGIPTYAQMVKFCFQKEIKNFEDLLQFMSPSNMEVLKDNYQSVEDIDLETAMQMENKTRGSIFGPTSTCVVLFQFHNLKYGDRFYFEHGNQTGSFTLDQIKELKKTSLAQLICKNVDGLSSLPKNAMLIESEQNQLVRCRNVEEPDYSKWQKNSRGKPSFLEGLKNISN